MSLLSRRNFLRLAGVTWAGSHVFSGLYPLLQPPSRVVAAPLESPQFGRILQGAAVFAAPSVHSGRVALLWPDSVVEMVDAHGEWYRVTNGFVQQTDIQPMFADPTASTPVAIGTWGEVVAPAVAIRAWCAADAPLIARVGHGAVLRVIDMLPPTRGSRAWYAIAESADVPIGWIPAQALQPLEHPTQPTLNIELDTRQHQLTVFAADAPVLCAPFATGKSLVKGNYQVVSKRPALQMLSPDDQQVYFGVPHPIELSSGDLIVAAYWHNQFGLTVAGDAIQVSPLLARWWYTGITADSRFTVR